MRFIQFSEPAAGRDTGWGSEPVVPPRAYLPIYVPPIYYVPSRDEQDSDSERGCAVEHRDSRAEPCRTLLGFSCGEDVEEEEMLA